MQAHATYTKMLHCHDARKLAITIKEKCPSKHCTIRYRCQNGVMKTRFVSYCQLNNGLLDIIRGQIVDMQEFSSEPGMIAYKAH